MLVWIGELICSGWVRGSWSRVALAAKCLPLFKHNAVLFKHVISPSSNTKKKKHMVKKKRSKVSVCICWENYFGSVVYYYMSLKAIINHYIKNDYSRDQYT